MEMYYNKGTVQDLCLCVTTTSSDKMLYMVFTKNQKVWLCVRGDLTSLFFSGLCKAVFPMSLVSPIGLPAY